MEINNEIQALELELIKPETRKNISRLDELISDDFEEIGSSGKVYRKQDVLSMLPQMESVGYILSHFVFKQLSQDCILVRYTATVLDNHTFRSSIWIKNGTHWQILYHQSTVILK